MAIEKFSADRRLNEGLAEPRRKSERNSDRLDSSEEVLPFSSNIGSTGRSMLDGNEHQLSTVPYSPRSSSIFPVAPHSDRSSDNL